MSRREPFGMQPDSERPSCSVKGKQVSFGGVTLTYFALISTSTPSLTHRGRTMEGFARVSESSDLTLSLAA
ncbi:hypothetical protein MHYP_G00359690 [Metynnis hypsauchen]